jgi:hypothetical protein
MTGIPGHYQPSASRSALSAVIFSVLFHSLLIAGLVWSGKLDSLLISHKMKDLKAVSAVLLIDKTYKPTDTAMKFGKQKKDLPPPNIEPPKSVDKEKEKPTLRTPKDKSPKGLKKNVNDILKNIREQAKEEKRPPPKDDNFPTHEKGEKKARGTGGRGDRILTPGEQALQAAMRKYYEVAEAESLRQKFPNARGFMTVRLASVASQFEIVSIALVESTGVDILDRRCELAVREALRQEVHAPPRPAEGAEVANNPNQR